MVAIGRSRGDIIFDISNYLILTLFLLAVVYPLYFIVIASFSNPNAIHLGKVWIWFKGFTTEGYHRIFRDNRILIGYRNSLFYMTFGTIINITITLPAAYALSRKDLYGRNFLMVVLIITMFFNGGLIPTYLLVRSLGMLNTVWAMVIPNALAVFYVIIARTFFQSTIPDELLDSARIDGCSNTSFFLLIVLPISKAVIAVMALFYGVAHWNGYFTALIYLRDKNLYPLQLVLREILIQNIIMAEMFEEALYESTIDRKKVAELIKYGVIIVGSLPLLMLYPFLQRYFVKGIMIGSIKG